MILSWQDKDIYAVSFLLTYSENSIYRHISLFPEFSVGYNTEEGCAHAPLFSEERWNFAFWEQNNISIINSQNSISANMFLDWCQSQKIKNIGEPESEKNMYDKNGVYVGRGPGGYIELVDLVSQIARNLQITGFLKKLFGNIPIIVHDLEYSWYSIDATKKANPYGEADTFLNIVLNNFEI